MCVCVSWFADGGGKCEHVVGMCESGNSKCVEAFSVFCNMCVQGLGWQSTHVQVYDYVCACVFFLEYGCVLAFMHKCLYILHCMVCVCVCLFAFASGGGKYDHVLTCDH